MPAMYLAGLPIPGPDVLELARLVDDQALAERLETAYGNGARILALEIQSGNRSSARWTTRQARRWPNFAAHSCGTRRSRPRRARLGRRPGSIPRTSPPTTPPRRRVRDSRARRR